MRTLLTSRLVFLYISFPFSNAKYMLNHAYTPSNFFNEFNLFTGDDPTSGFVNYVDQPTAFASGFMEDQTNSIYIGVDSDNVYPVNARGRPSVRLESKATYTHDILEGVNLMTANKPAAHTSAGCTISGSNQTATLSQPDRSPAAPGNIGCGSAMFRILSASFAGPGCDIDEHFKEHQIVFNITFCGAYGGNTFEANGCPMSVPGDGLGSCVAYVAGHPEGMKEAYWDINSLNDGRKNDVGEDDDDDESTDNSEEAEGNEESGCED
ncbi:uncharacterized protein BDZ99DRAFT_510390 [Mytilinidion resinicola]|uniref:Cell wall protein PhiA n=1 Tax=Mytilinidion resinicola TaxID=574789 RepID=A0A6A6YCU9_9PEZI|nr:uncharacterized protein BDZ99DRAFT_510390 [Mytilinidion resinicola]KAF2806656.1 hypothetical protein BDZ99DRAFT_510390 [Mytilinidion resinicola]